MKVKIEGIEFDDDIYPRKYISHETIENYVEALHGGAIFPPIEVQKVQYLDGTIKLICLDGKHRFESFKEFNEKIKEIENLKNKGDLIEATDIISLSPIVEVEATIWQDTALEKNEHLEELQIRSAKLNLIHGDRLGNNDLANVVLKILKARPIEKITGFVKEMGKQFDLDSTTIGRLGSEDGTISEVVEKLRLGRDVKIWKLLLLGRTQKEAGDAFGLEQRSVGQIREKLQTQIISIQNSYYKDKKTIEQIKEFNHLDEITAWGIILKGKDDLEKFTLFMGERK